jgi:hypothetical protein
VNVPSDFDDDSSSTCTARAADTSADALPLALEWRPFGRSGIEFQPSPTVIIMPWPVHYAFGTTAKSAQLITSRRTD